VCCLQKDILSTCTFSQEAHIDAPGGGGRLELQGFFHPPEGPCCRFRMFILDPGSEFSIPGSRIHTVYKIPDPGSASASKNLSFLTQKLFLSSQNYDPGCLFFVPDTDLDFLPFPGPWSWIQGSKRHLIPDPRSRSSALQGVTHLYSRRTQGAQRFCPGWKKIQIQDLGSGMNTPEILSLKNPRFWLDSWQNLGSFAKIIFVTSLSGVTHIDFGLVFICVIFFSCSSTADFL
jgi:hypothetical protein